MSSTPLDPVAAEQIAAAPLPTSATLRERKNVFIQFGRFIAFNLRIIRVIGMAK